MQHHGPNKFVFSSPDGVSLVRDLLRPFLPYAPHDYQLEGVCKCLDNTDLLAVLPTGAGKTAYFTMYILALIALNQRPSRLHPLKTIPFDPAILIVYPTTGLEEEMETVFQERGLTTVVINSNTRECARKQSKEDPWITARAGTSVILLSPEMLSTREFEILISSKIFLGRILMFAVDEVHLCDSWGQSFRPAFKQLPYIRARLPRHTVLAVVTATLTHEATSRIRSLFHLKNGRFHLIRRSNLRANIQLLFRTLRGAIDGPSFPDLDWIIQSRRKTIVFCTTIKRGDLLMIYLHSLLAKSSSSTSPPPTKRIRLYNSAFHPEYNTETRQLFRDDPDMQVIIATNTLMVGFDVSDIDDIVILGLPETADELLQKIGRAGRDWVKVPHARGIVYFSKTVTKSAAAMISASEEAQTSGGGKKKAVTSAGPSFDLNVARMACALCKTEAQNHIYDNPLTDPPCSIACTSCISRPPLAHKLKCDCSGCLPELSPPPVATISRPQMAEHERITKAMKAAGREELMELREVIYAQAPSRQRNIFPAQIYLPEPLIDSILLRIPVLHTVEELACLVKPFGFVMPYIDKLWAAIERIRVVFEAMRPERTERREPRVKSEVEDYGEVLQTWTAPRAVLTPTQSTASHSQSLYGMFHADTASQSEPVYSPLLIEDQPISHKRKALVPTSNQPMKRHMRNCKDKENTNKGFITK